MTTLYYQASQPFSQRVLLAFAYIKPDCQMVALESVSQLPKDVTADVLPVLLTDDEQLDNSLEIMDWALDQQEDNSWVDWDLDEMDDSLYILSLCDEPFNDYLQEYLNADKPEERMEAAEYGVGFLKQLDGLLGDSRYLLKDEPMLVDFAVLPFILQFIEQEPKFWASHIPPHLSRWLDAMKANTICQAVFG